MPKSKHTELWLVRCPGDFDPALLNGLALDLTRESTPVGDLCVREAAAAEAAELVVAAPGEKRWRIGRPFARQLVVGVPPARGGSGGAAGAGAGASAADVDEELVAKGGPPPRPPRGALRLRHSVEGVRGAPRAAAAAEESAAAEAAPAEAAAAAPEALDGGGAAGKKRAAAGGSKKPAAKASKRKKT